MAVTLESHIVRWSSTNTDETIASDWAYVEAWLVVHCAGKMTMLPGPGTDQIDIIFEDQADAMLWMLAWGGEYLRPYATSMGVCW